MELARISVTRTFFFTFRDQATGQMEGMYIKRPRPLRKITLLRLASLALLLLRPVRQHAASRDSLAATPNRSPHPRLHRRRSRRKRIPRRNTSHCLSRFASSVVRSIDVHLHDKRRATRRSGEGGERRRRRRCCGCAVSCARSGKAERRDLRRMRADLASGGTIDGRGSECH